PTGSDHKRKGVGDGDHRCTLGTRVTSGVREKSRPGDDRAIPPFKKRGLAGGKKADSSPKKRVRNDNREVRSSEFGSEGMGLHPASSHSIQKFLLVFPHLPDEGLIAGIFLRGGPENHFRA